MGWGVGYMDGVYGMYDNNIFIVSIGKGVGPHHGGRGWGTLPLHVIFTSHMSSFSSDCQKSKL